MVAERVNIPRMFADEAEGQVIEAKGRMIDVRSRSFVVKRCKRHATRAGEDDEVARR